MESKHTKGEWKRGTRTNTKEWMQIFCDGKLIAEAKPLNKIGHREAGDFKSEEANAKIIAAAPELLKVCTDLMSAFILKENDKKGNQTRTNIFKYCPEFREIAVATRSAIRKATE
jgi:hypothetical protein